ncbi:hypothetical protein HHI36_002719 [Cryptolaemus montrouzieri]|uniref:Uncharacterized protein n=1 Tax=Cryptolaemus montrouzieri TaxID=559131 RepID=A0ABD2PBD2_9CUCU
MRYDNKQSSTQIKLDLENSENPTSIGVGINLLKNPKSGSLEMKYNSMQSLKNLGESDLGKETGKNYQVKETNLRKPSCIVSYIEKRMKKQQLVGKGIKTTSFPTKMY